MILCCQVEGGNAIIIHRSSVKTAGNFDNPVIIMTKAKGGEEMNNIIIEGFIGSGKGSVGRALGKMTGMSVIDLDKRVSSKMGMTVADIYQKFGDVYYRAMETLVLKEMSEDEKSEPHIIILGSGAAVMPQNARYLKKLGRVYYLRMSPETLWKNMKKSKKHGWIEKDHWDEKVDQMYKEREPSYAKVADIVIDADGLSADEIAAQIAGKEQKKAD